MSNNHLIKNTKNHKNIQPSTTSPWVIIYPIKLVNRPIHKIELVNARKENNVIDGNIHFYYKSAKHSSNFGFHMLKRKIEQTKVTRNYKA